MCLGAASSSEAIVFVEVVLMIRHPIGIWRQWPRDKTAEFVYFTFLHFVNIKSTFNWAFYFYLLFHLVLEERCLWWVDFVNISFIKEKEKKISPSGIKGPHISESTLSPCSLFLLSLEKCSQVCRGQDFGATAPGSPGKLLHQGDETVHCSSSFDDLHIPNALPLDWKCAHA